MKLDADHPPMTTPVPEPALTDRAVWLPLAACVILFLVLRFRWLGHLLVWDEAMALCTARAFDAGGNDPFAAWFWRHPPLHTLLLLVLQPLQAGFAERAEILSIGVGAVNQGLLFLLNRRVWGLAAGLWSAFIIALLPGSALFDVWIKQDHLVATFGLLALLALVSRRTLWCGVCLGLALLTKGTAVFYCLAVFALWLGGACGRRTVKDFFLLTGLSALTCGWWYLGVLPRAPGSGGGDAFQFALHAQSLWQSNWSFYFVQLPVLLGWTGVVLAGAGAVWAVQAWVKDRAHEDRPAAWAVWPLTVLVPALVLISIVPNKVPWIVISLLPAWAALVALAVNEATKWLGKISFPRAARRRPALTTLTAACAVVLAGVLLTATTRDYEPMLRRVAESQWRGAANSQEAAEILNRNVRDDDRVLLTSFYYWQGLPPGLPDPIFTYYLVKKPIVLLRSHQRLFGEVVADIREHHLDWALLSPEPGEAASVLFAGFEQVLSLPPQRTTGAWLFRTTEVHRRATSTAAQ